MRKLSLVVLLLLSFIRVQANNINIFKADIEQKKVVLRWISYERRARCFIIEKSLDGVHFKNLKKVPAKKHTGKLYKEIDRQLIGNKIMYYRIRQVIDVNNFAYSTILAIRYQIPKLQIDVYPKLLMHGNVHLWLDNLHSRRVLVYALSNNNRVLYQHTSSTRFKSGYYLEIPRKYLNCKAIKLLVVTDQGLKREEITVK